MHSRFRAIYHHVKCHFPSRCLFLTKSSISRRKRQQCTCHHFKVFSCIPTVICKIKINLVASNSRVFSFVGHFEIMVYILFIMYPFFLYIATTLIKIRYFCVTVPIIHINAHVRQQSTPSSR